MKVFALKYKEEYIKFGTEYECTSDYRWEREGIKNELRVVYGTFTEEGKVELKEVKEDVSTAS